MLSSIPLGKGFIKDITDVRRNQLPFHEYSFFSDNDLRRYFFNNLSRIVENDQAISFETVSGSRILGIINCLRDDFDSKIFGFSCYRISDLLVFSDDYDETAIIVASMVSFLEKALAHKSLPYHLIFSLNNNTRSAGQIFNCLTREGFWYVQTLLTFFSQGNKYDVPEYHTADKLIIREVEKRDSDQVARLAERSFKYSRFHLDPFLCNKKASILLKKSAENSILEGFTDIMFVAEIEGRIVGYYSGKKHFYPEMGVTIGNAIISAVDEKHRGVGIFSKLDACLLNWFAANTDLAEMGTYLANYPVYKTWINKGLGLIRGTHQFSKFINR